MDIIYPFAFQQIVSIVLRKEEGFSLFLEQNNINGFNLCHCIMAEFEQGIHSEQNNIILNASIDFLRLKEDRKQKIKINSRKKHLTSNDFSLQCMLYLNFYI